MDNSSLLRRLYLDGVQGDDWLLIKDLYTDCSSRIKWAGGLSHPINIRQGVRQGGVLSTSHYKRYNNPLLLHLEQRYRGVKIGSIKIPHVTVADDLAVIFSAQSEAQAMVWHVEDNAGRERFFVNPSKSHTLKHPSNRKKECQGEIFMYNDKIENSNFATHLGIVRNINGKPDIDEKINIDRKTAYSLMGGGFSWGMGAKTFTKRLYLVNFCSSKVALWFRSIIAHKEGY